MNTPDPEKNNSAYFAPAKPRLPFPKVRSNVPLITPFAWVAAGWQDMRACGWASLFYGACFTLFGWLLTLAYREALEFLSGLTVGFLLVGPFLAVGLYALSKQREAGEPIRLLPTLTAWKTTRGAIGIYSVVLIIIYLVWARASMVIFALFYDGPGLPSLPILLAEVAQLKDMEFIATYLIVGGAFAGFVFALSLVSIPLMLDLDHDPVTAMIVSVLALQRNLPAAIVWGGTILVLTGFGLLTGFFGLLLTGPLVGHATWHAYRALVERPGPHDETNA
ncbi:MAG: DUF2189 domain-containing protein [Rhodocyclaceae bacterium]|nr:DUF2189 domain-containing protein [Rhodocyclaceae bacterium]